MTVKLPLTGLIVGEVPVAVLVCGDPGRATKTATHLQNATLLSDQREYRAFRGQYKGMDVAVCSHGIGAPGAAIAFEELITAGAKQIIRIGTCGGLQPAVETGHLVIVTGAVDYTGYGRQVTPAGYPALAHHQLITTLSQTAQASQHTHHTGLVLTSDSFYPGVTTAHTPDYALLSQANVMAVEMECAALFLVGSLRGVQTGAILAVDGNVLAQRESVDNYLPHRPLVDQAVEAEIVIALEALLLVGSG